MEVGRSKSGEAVKTGGKQVDPNAGSAEKDIPLMERKDIWLRDVCLACQSKHVSSAEKMEHSAMDSHMKRVRVYDFFSKEVGLLESVDRPSKVLQRYKRSRAIAIGLESVHELIMPFTEEPWWACSVCYVAGWNIDQLDNHVHSVGHKMIYIEEFHTDLMQDYTGMSRAAVVENLFSLSKEILETQGKLEVPEVLLFKKAGKDWAKEKLGISETEDIPNYTAADVFPGYEALGCKICNETVICAKETRRRCWSVHVSSVLHQRMQMIASTISQYECTDIENPFAHVVTINEWRPNPSGAYLGPLTGLNHLIYFGTSPYCDLCCSVLYTKYVVEHFRSESHILKYLTRKLPAEMYNAFYLPDDLRRSEMQAMLEKLSSVRLGGLPRKIEASCVPDFICEVSLPQAELNVPTTMPPLLTLGISQYCYWCPVCWKIINVPKDEKNQIAAWKEHCTQSRNHFEKAARRCCYHFDEENFADVISTVRLVPLKPEAVWETAKINGTEVQKLTDVGLEWIVDDIETDEVVCTVCAALFMRNCEDRISVHVRSYEHLMQCLQVTNREMFGLVKAQKTPDAERDLLMDFLQRSMPFKGAIRVYSANLADEMLSWGNVLYRKVEMYSLHGEERSVYGLMADIIDTVADDDVEKVTLPIKNALQMCSVRVHSIEGPSILFWCTHCERAFTANKENVVESVWDKHLVSEEHIQRTKTLAANALDVRGFLEVKAKFSPTVIDQADMKKRVTWRWNGAIKVFEFIYACVGLNDVVDRRSVTVGVPHVPDIYCSLCAEQLPSSLELLDAHMRSLKHVISFVHKYYTSDVRGLETYWKESAKDGGKGVRRFLGLTLKNEFGKIGKMRVYDPERVQKQKEEAAQKLSIEVEEKKKREEALRRMEQRRKEFELAKQKEKELDEQRRLLAQEERRRKHERERREEERKRREREKKKKEAEKRKKEEEKKKREEEEKKAEEGKKEAKRFQRLLHVVRQEEAERKRREEEERKKREERIARLQREEQELAIAQQAERERQRVIQLRLTLEREKMDLLRQKAEQCILQDEKRIEQEMLRIQQEKRLIEENLNSLTLCGPRPADREQSRSPLAVTILNPSAPSFTSPSFTYTASSPHPEFRGFTFPSRPLMPDGPSLSAIAKQRERCLNALKNIDTRELLVDYLWKQGSEPIPESELPSLFNSAAFRRSGLLGLSSTYQVICCDRPKFETMYCSACSVWTTYSEMFKHLVAPDHRLNYLFRNYKMYHKSAINQQNETVRAGMLEQYAQQIWKLEGSGEVRYRLRCVVDYRTVMRLWPDHVKYMSDDWMEISDRPVSRPAVTRSTPPPGVDLAKAEGEKSKAAKEKSLRSQESQQQTEPTKTDQKSVKEPERTKQEKEDIFSSKKKEAELTREKERKRENEKLKEKEKAAEKHTMKEKATIDGYADVKIKEETVSSSDKSSKAREKSKGVDHKATDGKESSKEPKSRDRERGSSRSRYISSTLIRHRSRSPLSRHSRRSRSPRFRRSRSSRLRRSASPRRKYIPHRSRSRSHDRRRGRSTSRKPRTSPLRLSNLLEDIPSIERPESDWNEAAAAFLSKIGDKKAANRLRKRSRSDSRSRDRSGSSRRSVRGSYHRCRSHSRPRFRDECRSRSRSRFHDEGRSHSRCRLHDDIRRESGGERKSVEERLKAEPVSRMMNVWQGKPSELDDEMDKFEKQRDQGMTTVSNAEGAAVKRLRIESQAPRDPKENMRKLLGVLMALQQEVEQTGRLDDSTILRLYREMGITSDYPGSSNELLKQLLQMLVASSSGSTNESFMHQQPQPSVDLQRFGITPAPEPSPPPLECVYPATLEPDPVEKAKEQVASPYTGFGGVDMQGFAGGQQHLGSSLMSGSQQTTSGSNQWKPTTFQLPNPSLREGLRSSLQQLLSESEKTGMNANLSSLEGSKFLNAVAEAHSRMSKQAQPLNDASGDVYAARQRKLGSKQTTNPPSLQINPQNASDTWASSSFAGAPSGPISDKERAQVMSRAAGYGLKVPATSRTGVVGVKQGRPSNSMQTQRGQGVVDHDDANSDDDVVVIDEREGNEKRLNYTKTLFQKYPDLMRYTGRNNPSKFVSTDSGYVGAAISAVLGNNSSSSAPNDGSGPWVNPADRLAAARNQQVIDHSPVMPIPANQIPVPSSSLPAKKNVENPSVKRGIKGARKKARARRRAVIFQARLEQEAQEEAKLAAAVEPLEDDIQEVDLWRGTASATNIASVSYDPFAQNSSSIGRSTVHQEPSWEELDSTVSALLSGGVKSVETSSNQNFASNMSPFISSYSSALGALPNSSRPPESMAPEVVVVTQYSGQPTTYSHPAAAPLYNPMAPNYGLPNTASSSFGASQVGTEHTAEPLFTTGHTDSLYKYFSFPTQR